MLVKLHQLDADILSVRHMAEPGYAAFAVMQIASRGLLGDVEDAARGGREVVGEVEFSFHSVAGGGAGAGGVLLSGGVSRVPTDLSTLERGGTRDGKGKSD